MKTLAIAALTVLLTVAWSAAAVHFILAASEPHCPEGHSVQIDAHWECRP